MEEELERLESKVKNRLQEVENYSVAMEFVTDYKKANARMFWIIIVILIMWFLTIGYLVYVLNDTSVVETTETTQEVTDVDTKNGNVVNNGDVYGED